MPADSSVTVRTAGNRSSSSYIQSPIVSHSSFSSFCIFLPPPGHTIGRYHTRLCVCVCFCGIYT
nr:MAG TPA: hypothetical protein [Caudoviricetes sp.]